MISPQSRSFLRHKEFALTIGELEQDFLINNPKSTILTYMIDFGYDDKRVINAELINNKSISEIQSIKKDLKEFVNSELKKENLKLKGIIEIHPTITGERKYQVEKTSHIHYWGSESKKVGKIISKFVKDRKLSVIGRVDKLDITLKKKDIIKEPINLLEIKKREDLIKSIDESIKMLNSSILRAREVVKYVEDVKEITKDIEVKRELYKPIDIKDILREVDELLSATPVREIDSKEFDLKEEQESKKQDKNENNSNKSKKD